LRNCLERAVLLANDGRITRSELPPEIINPATATTFVAQTAEQAARPAQRRTEQTPRSLRLCAKSSASRFSLRSNKPTGIAARPLKSSASHPPPSTGVCAITT
jgi:transcriptional regulator of acetoin/glycerol metabolism